MAKTINIQRFFSIICVALALMFALISCSKSELDCCVFPTENNTTNYLALGDSYTIGQSVEYAERWPVQLLNKLNTSSVRVDSVEIIAKTGWRTDNLLNAIDSKNRSLPYQLVSLLIGVNNQYQGLDPEVFRSEFVELLEQAIILAGNEKDRVFVLSIPDWGSTPFGASYNRSKISLEIDQFNSIIKSETEKKNVLFFDITPISRQALKNPMLIASDGLHPSGEMYHLWVESILPTVSTIDL